MDGPDNGNSDGMRSYEDGDVIALAELTVSAQGPDRQDFAVFLPFYLCYKRAGQKGTSLRMLMLRKFLISTLLAGPVLLSGCSAIPFADRFADNEEKTSKKDQKQLAAIAARPEVPPNILLDKGVRSINAGNNKEAQKAFNALNTQHPFSSEAQRAIVLSAYTHFTDKQYDQTIAKAQQFIQLYPGSQDAAYMHYLIGESYLKQVNAVILDQEDTRKGLQAYSDLIRLYPDSKYAADAKAKMLFMNDQLAGKEMQIGRYYQERRQHLAAINRFKTVADTYQTTRHIEEALYRLAESYLALGVVNDARSTVALMGYNYPDSEWYKDAYSLVTGEKARPGKAPSPSSLARLVPFVGGDKKKDEAAPGLSAEAAGVSQGFETPEATLEPPAAVAAQDEPQGTPRTELQGEGEKRSRLSKIAPFLGIPPKDGNGGEAQATPVRAVPAEAVPAVPSQAAPAGQPAVSEEQALKEALNSVELATEEDAKKKRSAFSKIAPFLGVQPKKDKDTDS